MEGGRPGCGKGPSNGGLIYEVDSTWLAGPDSPRTPLAALESSERSIGIADLGITYAPAGKRLGDGRGVVHQTYLGRMPDGKIRVVHSVGGFEGGGWAVETTGLCSYISEADANPVLLKDIREPDAAEGATDLTVRHTQVDPRVRGWRPQVRPTGSSSMSYQSRHAEAARRVLPGQAWKSRSAISPGVRTQIASDD